MKKQWLIRGVASAMAVTLGGCGSPQYSPLGANAARNAEAEAATPEVVAVAQEPAPVIGLDEVDLPFAHPVPASPSPTNAPPPAAARTFGSGWVPLRAWTERFALAAGERVSGSGTTRFRIPTRTGVCELTVGSRLARWDGVAVWLGFAPQMLRGEPHIHALDAEKTLKPLAELPPQLTTKSRTIVIDPGHGGADGGTRGARNELEKNFTLDWALRTERLLTNAGWTVFLTRRTDTDMSLPQRVAFAERVNADLFLSLHFNSTFPQTGPSGIETYCLTPAGAPSTLVRSSTDDARAAAFPNNRYDEGNVQWAFRLHQALLTRTRAKDDGLKRARFMSVLRHQNRPAVLIEGGFLSNPHDAANIQSASYREKLAQAIATALK